MDTIVPDTPRVLEVQVADAPEAWTGAGFTVIDDVATVDGIGFRLIGSSGDDRAIVGWTLSGLALEHETLDGLPTSVTQAPAAAAPASASHSNGVTGLDHIVVSTPDLERTIEAFAEAGIDLRRIRETESYGSPMRQAFFRFGPTIVEVVSGATGSGEAATDAPATWFGLAFDVADLDETAAWLGEGLGRVKTAVQPGRRIATIRHQQLGLSVAMAAMDNHADR